MLSPHANVYLAQEGPQEYERQGKKPDRYKFDCFVGGFRKDKRKAKPADRKDAKANAEAEHDQHEAEVPYPAPEAVNGPIHLCNEIGEKDSHYRKRNQACSVEQLWDQGVHAEHERPF